jgi:hypothetical protein
MRTASAAYTQSASVEWRNHEEAEAGIPRAPARPSQSEGGLGVGGIEEDGVLEPFHADRLQEYLVDGCDL